MLGKYVGIGMWNGIPKAHTTVAKESGTTYKGPRGT